MLSMEQAANNLAIKHPGVVERLTALHEAGARPALVGSRCAELGAAVLGIKLPPADDFDLQLPPEDFGLAVALLGAEVEESKVVRVRTGDGRLMRLTAHDARVRVGSDTIQFMQIQQNVRIGWRSFRTSFTPEAVAARTLYHTDVGILPVAHDAETLTLYGLRQGTITKHDAQRAAVVRAIRDPQSANHAAFRARQVGWDRRIKAFARTAAMQATALRHASAVAV